MQLELKYGKTQVEASMPDANIHKVLMPKSDEVTRAPEELVAEALANPILSQRLVEIAKAKQPQKVVIVVNDTTRPTPYTSMLPPLLKELDEAGVSKDKITFLVATGTHRGNTHEENEAIFGKDVANGYKFVNHDCTDAKALTNLGPISEDIDLVINSLVAEADLLITTGLISLHYFAGFSGGRKSIFPGVAGKELIAKNHAMMVDPRARTGAYKDNPVHYLMLDGARKAGVDFILNVVTNEKKQVVACVAGDLEQAWVEGVKHCEAAAIVPIDMPADVSIASAGGYPKDINMYQAQKAMDAAAAATKAGGTVILVAECKEGYGERTFEKWLNETNSVEDVFTRFDKGFELGGHKAFAIAQVLREKEVILISDLTKEQTENCYLTYMPDLEAALRYVADKHGTDYKAYVMPQAGMIYPKLEI